MIDWEKFAKENNLSIEDFKQELMICCGVVMSNEIDDKGGDEIKFRFSDKRSEIVLSCHRVKESKILQS